MKTTIITLNLCLTAFWGLGQKDKTFYSLEDANKVPVDSVYALSINNANESIIGIEKFKNLTKLEISNYQATSFPAEIVSLTQLKTLKIKGQQGDKMQSEFISPLNELPPSIVALQQLEHLDISFTSISKVPFEITSMPLLNIIDITMNAITVLPEEFYNYKRMKCLSVYYAKEQFTDAASLKMLKEKEFGATKTSARRPKSIYMSCL